MKKVFCILLLAVLCLPVLGRSADAAPDAFDYYGFYDRAGILKESDQAALNARLKEIYDRYGVSVFINLLSGDNVKVQDYIARFFIESVAPYTDEIRRGFIFAWDEKKNESYGAPFPNTDDRAMSAFSADIVRHAVSSSLTSVPSVFGALDNLAAALQKCADEYYGANPSGKVVKAPADAPGPSESEIAKAKSLAYTIDEEKIPSIYGVVGVRDIIAVQSGRSGEAEYVIAAYKTGSIEDDIAKYFAALGKDGWVVTKREGRYDKGSVSVAKRSRDKDHILAVTVEFRGASYQVNAAKFPGTLTVDKQPAPPVAMQHLFYDAFTMQVPKDWTVEKNKQGASIVNADKSSSIVIQVLEPFTQLPSREFAEKIRAQGKGSELKDNGDGLFSFTVEREGKTYWNLTGVIQSSGIYIFTTGQDPNLEAALKTLKLKLTFSPTVTPLLTDAGASDPNAATPDMKFWFYETLTMQTPKTWTVEKSEQAIFFFNADKTACIEVAVLEPFPPESRDFAEMVRDGMNGSPLEETPDGLFAYTSKDPDGAPWRNTVGMIGTTRIVMRTGGDDPDLNTALRTLKLKRTFVPNITGR